MVAGANYPNYSPAMYGGYAGAWTAANLVGSSLYANPGYGAVAGQMGMAAQPATYDYGSNVVVQPTGVYVNGDNVGTPEAYAQQAEAIASSGAAEPQPDTSWQPLGVFGLVEGGQTRSDDIFQIAINPQGLLRGNYHNLRDDSVLPLTGAVDPKSQRAAWVLSDDQLPIYEAGIANLTQDQTTMLIHTDGGAVTQATLVRMPPPDATSPAQP